MKANYSLIFVVLLAACKQHSEDPSRTLILAMAKQIAEASKPCEAVWSAYRHKPSDANALEVNLKCVNASGVIDKMNPPKDTPEEQRKKFEEALLECTFSMGSRSGFDMGVEEGVKGKKKDQEINDGIANAESHNLLCRQHLEEIASNAGIEASDPNLVLPHFMK